MYMFSDLECFNPLFSRSFYHMGLPLYSSLMLRSFNIGHCHPSVTFYSSSMPKCTPHHPIHPIQLGTGLLSSQFSLDQLSLKLITPWGNEVMLLPRAIRQNLPGEDGSCLVGVNFGWGRHWPLQSEDIDRLPLGTHSPHGTARMRI